MWLAAWPVVAVLALSNEPAPLYVLWQDDIGFSSATVTAVYAFYIAGLLATLTVAGTLSDRFGRKPVLLPGLALALLASVLFAVAHSVPALAVARLLSGVAVGAFLSAGMAAVSDLADSTQKRTAGLMASSAMVGGAAVGPLLAGLLSELAPGPSVTVFLVQIALLALALPVVLGMPLPRRTTAPDPDPAPTTGTGTGTGAGTGTGTDGTGTGRRLLRIPSAPRAHRRQLLLGLAVFAPAIAATGFVLSLGPTLLADLLHTSSRILSGSTIFVLFAAATGVQFAARRLRTRTDLLSGAALTVSSMVALTLAVATTSVTALVASAVLAGLGQGLTQLGALTMLSAGVPARRLAEANAALTAGGYVLAGALPLAAGALSDATSLTTGTSVFSATVAALSLAGAGAVRAGTAAARPPENRRPSTFPIAPSVASPLAPPTTPRAAFPIVARPDTPSAGRRAAARSTE
ncbi:MFS transporter [Streptomyces diacarni]|uniref:MFS transporter n=1 Tax=Streptomyces diacarni TaxID=2800381 RepID=A0A367FCY2_9ACTN|nr:MFS transporter [Streptomyces diacarni]RCG28131.1 MFS transporter [Streptomyces diacarni]